MDTNRLRWLPGVWRNHLSITTGQVQFSVYFTRFIPGEKIPGLAFFEIIFQYIKTGVIQ